LKLANPDDLGRVRFVEETISGKVFWARIVTAGPVKDNPIKGLEAGEGKIVARLKFVNGAVKWAFIDKDRAVLLW
jgi:hypothetical protein